MLNPLKAPQISWPASVTLHLALLLLPCLAGAQETFYVDPGGDDGNPGTAAQPLRTFGGAVQKVRAVLDGAGDVEVVFSHLGREAIVLTGRAPGRGDVNRDHTISANHISATGREKWTAPAILIDQSSSNAVTSNYITDTDFTAIVLTAPRQLAMLSHGEAVIDGGGGSQFADVYRQMYATLCPSPAVPASPWPGAAAMQAELAATLVGLGSAAPSCTAIFADGFESGDVSAWSGSQLNR